jgi:hypothetical protein
MSSSIGVEEKIMAAVVDSVVVSISCSGTGGFPLISKTGYNIGLLTGDITGSITDVQAVSDALAPLSTGVISQTNMIHGLEGSTAYPSGVANRGSKWICTWNDNTTGDVHTTTIPAASALTADLNDDKVTAKLTSTHWAAYKAAMEAVAKSPAGNAVTLLRAKLGGRRA